MLELIELELDSDYARGVAGDKLVITDTPLFELPNTIQYVESMKITEVSVPISYYALDSTCNALNLALGYYNDGSTLSPPTFFNGPISLWGPPYVYGPADDDIGVHEPLFFPTGTYNVQQFLDYMNPKTAEGLANFWWPKYNAEWGGRNPYNFDPALSITWGYDTIKAKLTVTVDNNGVAWTGSPKFLVETPFEKAAIVFGWKTSIFGSGQQFYGENLNLPDGLTTYTFTSPAVVQMQGPSVMYLNSKKLGSLVKTILPRGTFANGEAGTQIAMIPITANYTEVLNWQDPSEAYAFDFKSLPILDRFDLYFTLGHETTALAFNGVPFQVKMTLQVRVGGEDNNSSNPGNDRVIKRLRPA